MGARPCPRLLQALDRLVGPDGEQNQTLLQRCHLVLAGESGGQARRLRESDDLTQRDSQATASLASDGYPRGCWFFGRRVGSRAAK